MPRVKVGPVSIEVRAPHVELRPDHQRQAKRVASVLGGVAELLGVLARGVESTTQKRDRKRR